MSEMTAERREAAFKALAMLEDAIAEAIKALDQHGMGTPSGPLYAHLMGKIDLLTYNMIIDRLVKRGAIRKSNHVLYWTGGK